MEDELKLFDLMTPTEAATALRVSRDTIILAIKRGDLQALKVGSRHRIRRSALLAWVGESK